VPERKQVRELDRKVMSLESAMLKADASDEGERERKELKETKNATSGVTVAPAGASPFATGTSASNQRLEGMSRVRRVMHEMRNLLKVIASLHDCICALHADSLPDVPL
jgi:hypothetical protein